ncbi:MAG: hypothetical protein ACI85O_002674, partial [Saprospiraceae bacterium]
LFRYFPLKNSSVVQTMQRFLKENYRKNLALKFIRINNVTYLHKPKTMKFTNKILSLFLLINVSTYFSTFAQSTDKEAVIAVVDALFDGMREGDTEKIDSLFLKEATMISIYRDEKGMHQRKSEETANFGEVIGKHMLNELDEKIWSYDVNINQDLATVWTDYTFFYKGEVSHCGVNSFTLHQTEYGWKILNITDTRSKQNCQILPTDVEKEVNNLMNTWHKAAATADEDVFFGSMKKGGIYIGTDQTELWTGEEMKEWAKEYFEKDSAWDFTTIERNVYSTDNEQVVWFDEKLDTWMGVCRSSGVVEKVNGEWKISHYHLSVTIDNDLIKGFVELTKP